jgi:hypothetical protein
MHKNFINNPYRLYTLVIKLQITFHEYPKVPSSLCQTNCYPLEDCRNEGALEIRTACFPGSSCLKVVASEIGGTTARLPHCSGSCPTWMACVEK